MLFDLRGAHRRRVVKIVYIALALLMGGGLVLFGVGGAVSGGLVDAITNNSGGGGSTNKRLEQTERAATRRARANPTDAAAWAAVARARFNVASADVDPSTNAYSADGRRMLRLAGDAWEKHVDLAKQPDDRVASLMVQAYVTLGDLVKATRAQEVVAQARNSGGTYAQLAQLAYQAGQTRTGDLARRKALALTPKDLRENIKGQLDAARSAAPSASGSPSSPGSSGSGSSSGK